MSDTKITSEALEKYMNDFNDDIQNVATSDELFLLEKKYLGRKDGLLTTILKGLKDVSLEEKKVFGPRANEIREMIEEKIVAKRESILSAQNDSFDYTEPGEKTTVGHLHPHTIVANELRDIFQSLNFEVVEGIELENDYYTFEALNMPSTHPAREMWDTYYIKNQISKIKYQKSETNQKSEIENQKLLLRVHTSAMQMRMLEKRDPPVRVAVIGKCFRREALDASHEHTFYQIEGFAVDTNISIANMIFTLKTFLNAVLKRDDVVLRLRPSFFPFVEPGYEVDIKCVNCGGEKCAVCKYTGWVELLGCGMIHPNVLRAAGYNVSQYRGFAFGTGLDRLVMMKYKIDDIRLFESGDLRFIRQF
ncbi:MAG: phenylalanine--tRNA ligase subunit alpha [Parcubacteria group bacterium]|nr:phenylalanine--tRNA ligase subunit alpha [Parcubacteria group bacterium]